ncbi:MAG: head-tail connector protein [Ruminococcus sp.]|nr:head-tail connector protein [Ruminococcus sp.]
MKISEITPEIVKDYCGISDDDSNQIITVLMSSAKAYIVGYTGLSAEEIDLHEDLTTAFMVLINDMYTQRDFTLSFQKQVNPVVRTILGLYAVNYL